MTQALAFSMAVVVARAEFKVDLNDLKDLEQKFRDPRMLAALYSLPGRKEIAALVSQAITDNFDQEGPGWQPLKGATIRNSVALNKMTKAMLKDAKLNAADKLGATRISQKTGRRTIDAKRIKGNKKKFYEYVDREIEHIEKASRLGVGFNGGGERDSEPLGNRQILRRTNTLFKTVTTAGASTASATVNGKTITGQGIRKVEGFNLIWGTNLIYAATHQNGRGAVPARPYLVLREEWKKRLMAYAVELVLREIANGLGGR